MAALFDLGRSVLAEVVAFYAGAGVDLPDRRLVSLGQAPWDCPLVNVWVERSFAVAGSPADEVLESIGRHPGHAVRAATVQVQVARSYPIGSEDGLEPPPVAEEEAAAEVVYRDAELLWRALLAGEYARRFSQPNGLAFEGWSSVGPGGGMAGGLLTVRMLL